MDGMDLSSIDQIDQDIFNGSPDGSDDEQVMPQPECIGVDSALQDDDEETRRRSVDKPPTVINKSRTERELEMRVLKPNSIRRQILERSLTNGDATASAPNSINRNEPRQQGCSHVMNIIEKAGMSGIDKEKINQIIHEASKGSLFYRKQAQRQAEIHRSIEKMLNRVKAATPTQVDSAMMTCDRMIEDLQKQRVFNKVIVHFDLDMFFAAVEIRDNPALKDRPIAVGGDSMVSTSNYIARRFGVRAAMPGFIARKLCPDLVLIKPNGSKYRQASSEVFTILEQYDPELTSMSLDEAYLDLTEYVKSTLERDGLDHQEYYDGTLPKIWWTRASEVVEEIRQAIFEKTQLTCSAGIACNTLLAKVSSDINKPDGQYMVEGYPKDVSDFISKTPVEKVSGIGKVSAQFLNALDIKTCGDILGKRHYLPLVFYEINIKFYLRVAIGDGSTSIKSDEQRKSKSVERTFPAIKDTLVLLDKLDSICDELCNKYLKPYRIRGRTITVKLKRNTFTTTTKSYSLLVPTNDKLVIYSTAKNLLLSEVANELSDISYRLLGVKLSNLADDGVATNQLTIDAMLKNQEMSKLTKSDNFVHRVLDDNPHEAPSEGTSSTSDLITQEHPIVSIGEMKNDCAIVSDAHENTNEANGSQKRPAPTEPRIESFFRKRVKSSSETGDKPDVAAKDAAGNPFFSQEEDGKFFDASSHADFWPNPIAVSPASDQNVLEEDFRCPYCFKPFANFENLEMHVNSCRFKTSVDVNKSFFSQKSKWLTAPNIPTTLTQVKPISSNKKPNTKTQPRQSVRLSATRRNISTVSSQSTQNNDNMRDNTTNDSPSRPSFYQRFLESNSQSLVKSVKKEPFQCPYCFHGFLAFSALETHVIMCTKQKLS